MVAEFLELVSKKNTLQKKQMRRLRLSEKEREELEQVLRFFANEPVVFTERRMYRHGI